LLAERQYRRASESDLGFGGIAGEADEGTKIVAFKLCAWFI
jgi:uncharacterized membrane protein YtjA (UPF0391 family)